MRRSKVFDFESAEVSVWDRDSSRFRNEKKDGKWKEVLVHLSVLSEGISFIHPTFFTNTQTPEDVQKPVPSRSVTVSGRPGLCLQNRGVAVQFILCNVLWVLRNED